MAKISKKLRIKWNFELTVFELTVPGPVYDYISYWGDPSYAGIFPLELRMSMIFTDFRQCLWLLENLLISKFTEVPTAC